MSSPLVGKMPGCTSSQANKASNLGLGCGQVVYSTKTLVLIPSDCSNHCGGGPPPFIRGFPHYRRKVYARGAFLRFYLRSQNAKNMNDLPRPHHQTMEIHMLSRLL